MAHVQDEEAYALLEPIVRAAVGRMESQRFSTKWLIDELRSTRDGEAAYRTALEIVEQSGATDHMAHLVVHGQVVPGLLRRCGLVRFAGFIHGDPEQDDGYAVPSWWQRV